MPKLFGATKVIDTSTHRHVIETVRVDGLECHTTNVGRRCRQWRRRWRRNSNLSMASRLCNSVQNGCLCAIDRALNANIIIWYMARHRIEFDRQRCVLHLQDDGFVCKSWHNSKVISNQNLAPCALFQLVWPFEGDRMLSSLNGTFSEGWP